MMRFSLLDRIISYSVLYETGFLYFDFHDNCFIFWLAWFHAYCIVRFSFNMRLITLHLMLRMASRPSESFTIPSERGHRTIYQRKCSASSEQHQRASQSSHNSLNKTFHFPKDIVHKSTGHHTDLNNDAANRQKSASCLCRPSRRRFLKQTVHTLERPGLDITDNDVPGRKKSLDPLIFLSDDRIQ
jgi:hypothetical protein